MRLGALLFLCCSGAALGQSFGHTIAFKGAAAIQSVPASSNTITDLYGNVYLAVVAKDGKTWLDRNLGATQAATNLNDIYAYGSLFQWGRTNDGHELITWSNPTTGAGVYGTTATLSTNDIPGTNRFIITSASPYDWRDPQNNLLWQGSTNNPCPSGYRPPTISEWATLITAEGITNSTSAFTSTLKLTVPGNRDLITGDIYAGANGYYYTTTLSTFYAYAAQFTPTAVSTTYMNWRSLGFSVRAIKN